MIKLKHEISAEFESTDQGIPKYMLGIQIEVNPENNSLRLSQENYIEKVIDRFDIDNEKNFSCPNGLQYKIRFDNRG